MRRAGLDGSCWPDADTEDVLRAALLDAPRAAEAWARVRPGLDLRAHALADRQRLLPLVLANLGAEHLGDDAADLKRRHREVWRDNRLHVHHAPRWLDPLAGEVPVLLLKGMALALGAYPDLGRRPMNDIDVLVPSTQIGRAVRLLTDAGWTSAEDRPLPRSWRARHGVPLVHPDGGHVDVHLVPGVPFLGRRGHGPAVPEVWAAARPASLADRPVLVPAPDDLLLNVLVHGLTSVPGSSSRWVADATVLLRSQEVDWPRLVDQARRHHVVLPVRSALRYLADAFHAPVPADALWALWAVPVDAGDRRRFEVLTGAVGTDDRAGSASIVRARWARLRTAVGPVRSAAALPRFAADLLRVDRPRHVPGELLRRARRRPSAEVAR